MILGPFLSLTKVRSAYWSISLYHIGRYGDSEFLFSLCSPTIQDNLNLRRTKAVHMYASHWKSKKERTRERFNFKVLSNTFHANVNSLDLLPRICLQPLNVFMLHVAKQNLWWLCSLTFSLSSQRHVLKSISERFQIRKSLNKRCNNIVLLSCSLKVNKSEMQISYEIILQTLSYNTP